MLAADGIFPEVTGAPGRPFRFELASETTMRCALDREGVAEGEAGAPCIMLAIVSELDCDVSMRPVNVRCAREPLFGPLYE